MDKRGKHWEELSEFESCESSPLVFRALIALLETWPDDDVDAAIKKADSILSHWPDEHRCAPWSWCKAAAKGEAGPAWPLVRATTLAPSSLTKGRVSLARLSKHVSLDQITQLEVPAYSEFKELSFLYHCPDKFPALKKLRASDKFDDGEIKALSDSPLWNTLEQFNAEDPGDSFVHRQDASRLVPNLPPSSPLQHISLRAPDLIELWNGQELPNLHSIAVIVRSIEEAKQLAARVEISSVEKLSLIFRCGFSGSSPFEPFLGTIIEPDEAAAEAFFTAAALPKLQELCIHGISMGYWGREGLGHLGCKALIQSGLLHQVHRLHLELLPLGDEGIAALAPALGPQLKSLLLRDVYCKSEGAIALAESPCLESVNELDLSGNRIGVDGFKRLASLDMPNLRKLDLSGPNINPYYWDIGQQPMLDEGAIAWAESRVMCNVERLGMRNCFLGDGALEAIFHASHLENRLQQIDLSDNQFSAKCIADSVTNSRLWNQLKFVGLNNCRLDDDAVTALCWVTEAPKLRAISLDYNCIGPKGAAALAQWPVLSRVWQLDLHDNFIGDEGLAAIARSPYLGRLVELGLEQDCWNSRAFDFKDETAEVLANSNGLIRLDSFFSGCIDEYHGAAYSPGFSKEGLNRIRKSKQMRASFRASCSDFSQIDDYHKSQPFDENKELNEQDFRANKKVLNEEEAEAGENRMRQISAADMIEEELGLSKAPQISELESVDDDMPDIIEGIEYREAIVPTDEDVELTLSLEDDERPLPKQVGKFLSDSMSSWFEIESLGYFDVSGGSARMTDDGQTIDTDVSFALGVSGDQGNALAPLRETLWWLGAPENTGQGEVDLDLGTKPFYEPCTYLHLANLKTVKWGKNEPLDYRIDRVPFSDSQRQGILKLLNEVGAEHSNQEWLRYFPEDDGSLRVYVKHLNESDSFDSLNLRIYEVSEDVSQLIFRLMSECGLMLLPFCAAATDEVARTIDVEWPKVKKVRDSKDLHGILWLGPYHWWEKSKTSN